MPYETLKLDYEGDLAVITLNRPEKRNAISPQVIADLASALHVVGSSPARVLILTGAGKAFCSGMDLDVLRSIASQSQAENVEDTRRMAGMFLSLYRFPKPTIAAVNGAALAGGCGLATLCDFTLAAPEATFGYTEVRIGFIPALVSVFLKRQVGEKIARDLLLTARIFSAEAACRIGLVNEVVPADKLMERASGLAGTLLASSPTSLSRTKFLLDAASEDQINREIELAIEENAAIRSTPDFKEGLDSFLQKRKPHWADR